MEIQIVIKAPNQNVDDHVVHCNLDWTVENLKDHLSKEYPNKPMVQEQKLIYSGRLLHNNLQLKDVLRHEESQSPVHILHLVCSGNYSYEQPSQSWGRASTPRSQAVNNSNGGRSSSNTIRHRNVASAPHTNTQTLLPQIPQNPTPPVTMPVFVPDSQVVAQIAAMQQMYAYYFTQYIQSVNPPTVPATNPVFPNLPIHQQPANDIPAPEPDRVRFRLNGQAAQLMEEIEDFVMNRDWLDHIFLACRVFILVGVILLYSTPERLMIVLVFAVIAFLYQEGWFVRRATPPPPEAVTPPENADIGNLPRDIDTSDEEPSPPDVRANQFNGVNPDVIANEPLLVNQDFTDEEELYAELDLQATMDGDDPPHARQNSVANNNHIFSPLNFLSTFFTSMIPENIPPPVNIN